MGKRKTKPSEKVKNIKKQEREENKQQRKKSKPSNQKEKPIETCSLKEKNLVSLSYSGYKVYYITNFNEQKIAFFGVFSDGKYNYSVICDDADEAEILSFIKGYICKLGLIPKENPKLYKPK